MNIVTNIMDFTMDIALLIGNIGYMGVEGVLMFGVFIIHPFNEFDDKMKIHASVMNECNSWCKNKYNDICYDIGWKACGLISQWKQFHKKTIIPSFHTVTNNYFKPCVFLLKDGIEIANYNSWQQYEIAKEDDLTLADNYNSVLYIQYDDEEDCKRNYTIIGDRNLKNPDSLLKHKSNVSFILFQLTTEGIKYDISLKEPMNFFVKDNTLNYSFFKWYMKRIYEVELSACFSVNYMTGDMSVANLHNPFFIKFSDLAGFAVNGREEMFLKYPLLSSTLHKKCKIKKKHTLFMFFKTMLFQLFSLVVFVFVGEEERSCQFNTTP